MGERILSAEKTRAFVLKVLPYRESSCILTLFTERHGLLQGIAKGIKRAKPGGLFLERGMLLELLAYIRPHRDLQTLGSIQIAGFYPSIRLELTKTALRDTVFELTLKTITHSDYHPELFSLIADFLAEVDEGAIPRIFPSALWKFLMSFLSLMGFEASLGQCIECGKPLGGEAGGIFQLNNGGVCCDGCSPVFDPARHLTGGEVDLLRGKPAGGLSSAPAASAKITRILASYCAHHFELTSELKSVAFLQELLCAPEGKP
jgi:DNA repair protein RecO (recombination protein O)